MLLDASDTQKGAPFDELFPSGHAVHELAPSLEYVLFEHSTHAEPEKYVPAVQVVNDAAETVEASGQFEDGGGIRLRLLEPHDDEVGER